MVLLNNDKLMKSTTKGGRLVYIKAILWKNDIWRSFDLLLIRSCMGYL